MKNLIKVYALLAAGLIMMCTITGCSDKKQVIAEDTQDALAIVVGNHLCSKELNLNSPLIMDAVSDTIGNYGFISVISVDGLPSLIAADSYDIPEQYKNAAKSKLRADAENKAHNLMMKISEVKADDSEVDTLEALRTAVRSFASAEEGASRKIIVVDTGWSTTGLLDFGNNLINAEPSAVAEMLAEKDAIPDLTGTTVIWQQLGDVAEPQQELSPGQTLALEAIWQAIIEKGGGSFKCSATVPNEGSVGGSLPGVSTIELQMEEPVKFDESKVETEEISFDAPVIFGEEQIQFKGDSDEFVDIEKALSCIRPVADYMNGHPGFNLLLVGTTAGDEDNQYVRELSYARASAVKKTLVELGISEDRIMVKGLGNHDPWHIYGVGTEGELAAQNRKVVMISAEAEEAVKLLDE